jgi:hypothetical protein
VLYTLKGIEVTIQRQAAYNSKEKLEIVLFTLDKAIVVHTANCGALLTDLLGPSRGILYITSREILVKYIIAVAVIRIILKEGCKRSSKLV